MAAAKGNQYAAKERIWRTAIDKALEERGGELGRMGALKELAHKLLDRVAEGDMTALKEFGDRMDGKTSQQVELTGANGGPVMIADPSKLTDEQLAAIATGSGAGTAE